MMRDLLRAVAYMHNSQVRFAVLVLFEFVALRALAIACSPLSARFVTATWSQSVNT